MQLTSPLLTSEFKLKSHLLRKISVPLCNIHEHWLRWLAYFYKLFQPFRIINAQFLFCFPPPKKKNWMLEAKTSH